MNQPSPVNTAAKALSYEQEVKARISEWHSKLKELADAKEGSIAPVQKLKAVVETELAIAELKIKAREADHAKVLVWLLPVLSPLCAIIGVFIGAWLKS